MSFEIASYNDQPALVLDRYTQELEDGTSVDVADVRVFSRNPIDSDQFYNGVELDATDDTAGQHAAEPEPPTTPATPGQPQA